MLSLIGSVQHQQLFTMLENQVNDGGTTHLMASVSYFYQYQCLKYWNKHLI